MHTKNTWVEKQWPSTLFMDPRVHKRALCIAQACMAYPDRSIPKRFSKLSDTKGCYRFLKRKEMNHQLLQSRHYENTLAEAKSRVDKVLFIQDGSSISYTSHQWTTGLGSIGGYGEGIMFHSCLAVEMGKQPQVIGLACQEAWVREAKQKANESDVWQKMIQRIGKAPKKGAWIAVGDRGSDIFRFIEVLKENNWDCVLRTRHDRKIYCHGEMHKVHKYMAALPSMAEMEHIQRARPGRAKRTLQLQISWTEAEITEPNSVNKKIAGSYVRIWSEEDTKIEWLLFTLSQVKSEDKAREIVDIYTQRWIIEEYHKCLKTGCRVEEAQLRDATSLFALFGFLGVIATQLLQLRDLSRRAETEHGTEHVDEQTVTILERFYRSKERYTVKEFWRRVAMLGGFLGRKSDGDPGWETIWYGWLRLQDMVRGAKLAAQLE